MAVNVGLAWTVVVVHARLHCTTSSYVGQSGLRLCVSEVINFRLETVIITSLSVWLYMGVDAQSLLVSSTSANVERKVLKLLLTFVVFCHNYFYVAGGFCGYFFR